MVFIAIPSLLAGAVLAQRFRVMILLPATGVVLMAATSMGLIASYGTATIVVIAAIGGASMHIGYLLGLSIRYMLETPSRESPQPARTTAPAGHWTPPPKARWG